MCSPIARDERPALVSAALSLALGLTCAAHASAGTTYTAVELGTMGGTGSIAYGVNDNGEAVGVADLEGGALRAFFHDGSKMIELPTLPGGGDCRAFGLSNKGQVVGVAANKEGRDRAVLWERSGAGVWEVTDLGLLPGAPSAGYALARRINDSGAIVGTAASSSGRPHAFIWRNGAMEDMGILHYPATWGISEAAGLNDAGHAVGFAYAPLFGPDHGFHFDGESQADITPEQAFGFARGQSLNNAGLACGIIIKDGGASEGFEAGIFNTLDPRAGWTELGVLNGMTQSEAYDLNESGVVVGYSYNLETQVYLAFVYEGSKMTDLNDLTIDEPGTIADAWGVNEDGVIAANVVTKDGPRAVLLKPVVPCPTDLDGDGQTGASDLAGLLGAWGASGSPADINGDGAVGSADLAALLGAWGPCA